MDEWRETDGCPLSEHVITIFLLVLPLSLPEAAQLRPADAYALLWPNVAATMEVRQPVGWSASQEPLRHAACGLCKELLVAAAAAAGSTTLHPRYPLPLWLMPLTAAMSVSTPLRCLCASRSESSSTACRGVRR